MPRLELEKFPSKLVGVKCFQLVWKIKHADGSLEFLPVVAFKDKHGAICILARGGPIVFSSCEDAAANARMLNKTSRKLANAKR